MKKIILILVVVIIAGISGYFVYIENQNPEYRLNLDSEVNWADRHFENITSEHARSYWKNGNYFSVTIGTFKDKETASTEMTRLVEVYKHPGSGNLDGKYMYYRESGGTHWYLYQSGKNIIMTDSSAPKEIFDSFVVWLHKEYMPI